ncbi:Cotton fiber expressed protein [Quillaja saponaria]|uniref:Cotton fiber expressed protein n=1 Tax=Quillaja saponaria TaxID=32244 RepID=A0AAD7PV63_QUISA|nr:Cotton fiber expressed protein [Quillaja saponaria]
MEWLLSLKVLLISFGVIFMALGLKLSVPMVLEFSVSHVPVMWNFFLSWLKPPYLYIVINGIIISIAASWRFHQNNGDQTEQTPPSEVPADLAYEMKNAPEIRSEFAILEPPPPVEKEVTISEVKTVVVNGSATVVEDEDKNEIDGIVSTWKTPNRLDSTENLSPAEKPLVSARFGGRALRVSNPKQHETMENTWKAIMEGRERQMKKCDTWENHSVISTPMAMKLRKEASLSQDELNRRVEAFIQKFNEEMRLQREESLNQYKEMINHGGQ